MPKLILIQLENGQTLYMEAQENVVAPNPSHQKNEETPVVRGGNVRGSSTEGVKKVVQHFEVFEKTLSSFTSYALNAFKQVAGANVDKVTLEFGVTVGGEAGIPYITKGSAEGNLKIKIECSLSDKSPKEAD